MIVESIHIEEFGKLSDFSLSFDKGLNIIEGANESGKSTVAAFVRFMLYGFPPASDNRLSERKKRLSWKDGTAAGSMIVTVGKRRYEIIRSVSTNPDGSPEESVSVTDLETGFPAFPHAVPGDAILGIPDDVFASTAFVSQIADAKVGGAPVAEAIENLIFSGDEKINTARATEQLSEAKNSLLHTGGRGGALFTMRQKQDELERRLAIAVKEHHAVLEKEANLALAKEKRDESERQEKAFRLLETDYKNAMLIKTYDYLHELEENAEAIRKNIDALDASNRHGGYLPKEEDREKVSRLIEAIEARKTEETEAADAERLAASRAVVTDEDAALISKLQTAGGDAEVRFEARLLAQKRRLFLSLMIALPILALGLFLLGAFPLAVPFLSPNSIAWFFIVSISLLLLGGVAMLLPYLHFRRRLIRTVEEYGENSLSGFEKRLAYLVKEKERLVTLTAEATEAKKTLARAKEKYGEALAEASRFLMQSGDTLPTEDAVPFLAARAEETVKYLSQREELLKKKSGVDNVIRELRTQLGDKNEVQVRATVAPGDRDRLINMDHRELLDAIEHYRRLAHFYDDRMRELERQLITARMNVEDPLLLAAEIDVARENIELLLLRHGAYTLAEDAIRHAGERLRTEITPRLAGYAGRFMEIATNGKYKALSVSKNIEIAFTQDENEHSADFLSAGTQDVAYLSLRMALIDLLCDEMPPLFFDESFAHQDDTRADGLIAAVRALTEEGKQIFLFTCHTRESRMAKSHFEHFKHIRFGVEADKR